MKKSNILCWFGVHKYRYKTTPGIRFGAFKCTRCEKLAPGPENNMLLEKNLEDLDVEIENWRELMSKDVFEPSKIVRPKRE